MEIKRDTAVFSRRQWYIDGYAQHWFSTEEDAKAALALAGQIVENEKREICNTIREALPR
jgi:hypothetical protein